MLLSATEFEVAPLTTGLADAELLGVSSMWRVRRGEVDGVPVCAIACGVGKVNAAVAQVAAAYGVALIELRGVSNVVAQRDKSRWRVQAAVDSSCAAAKRALFAVSGTTSVREGRKRQESR